MPDQPPVLNLFISQSCTDTVGQFHEGGGDVRAFALPHRVDVGLSGADYVASVPVNAPAAGGSWQLALPLPAGSYKMDEASNTLTLSSRLSLLLQAVDRSVSLDLSIADHAAGSAHESVEQLLRSPVTPAALKYGASKAVSRSLSLSKAWVSVSSSRTPTVAFGLPTDAADTDTETSAVDVGVQAVNAYTERRFKKFVSDPQGLAFPGFQAARGLGNNENKVLPAIATLSARVQTTAFSVQELEDVCATAEKICVRPGTAASDRYRQAAEHLAFGVAAEHGEDTVETAAGILSVAANMLNTYAADAVPTVRDGAIAQEMAERWVYGKSVGGSEVQRPPSTLLPGRPVRGRTFSLYGQDCDGSSSLVCSIVRQCGMGQHYDPMSPDTRAAADAGASQAAHPALARLRHATAFSTFGVSLMVATTASASAHAGVGDGTAATAKAKQGHATTLGMPTAGIICAMWSGDVAEGISDKAADAAQKKRMARALASNQRPLVLPPTPRHAHHRLRRKRLCGTVTATCASPMAAASCRHFSTRLRPSSAACGRASTSSRRRQSPSKARRRATALCGRVAANSEHRATRRSRPRPPRSRASMAYSSGGAISHSRNRAARTHSTAALSSSSRLGRCSLTGRCRATASLLDSLSSAHASKRAARLAMELSVQASRPNSCSRANTRACPGCGWKRRRCAISSRGATWPRSTRSVARGRRPAWTRMQLPASLPRCKRSTKRAPGSKTAGTRTPQPSSPRSPRPGRSQ